MSSSIGANPDLKVRLLHGESDSTILYQNSVGFAAMLADAGYDVVHLAISTIVEVMGP